MVIPTSRKLLPQHASTSTRSDIPIVLLEIYAANDAMNQLILAHLDPKAWRAQPPGPPRNGRTIAAIVAHLPVKAWAGIWWWDKLWKEIGLTTKPRQAGSARELCRRSIFRVPD